MGAESSHINGGLGEESPIIGGVCPQMLEVFDVFEIKSFLGTLLKVFECWA